MSIKGKTIVFYGTLVSGSRSQLQNQATELGIKVCSSISKRVDILVVGLQISSERIEKAEKLGIEIIDEQTYLNLLAVEITHSSNQKRG